MISIYRDATSVEAAAGDLRTNNQIRIPFAYRSLTINDDTYEVDQIAVTPAYDAVTEPRAQTDGMEAYEVRKIQAVILGHGIVRADNLADLCDNIDALNEAFDPALARVGGTTNDGFRDFTFDYPTADTANYSDGLIPMLYYARSLQPPVSMMSKYTGLSVPFTLNLLVADPRRYLQTTDTASRTGTGDLVVDNSLASYYSWPTITISLTGDGGSLSIKRPADSVTRQTKTLVLDLSDLGDGDEVVIDCFKREITVNDTVDNSVYSSGDYFDVGPSSNTLVITGTLAGTIEVEWRRAFV